VRSEREGVELRVIAGPALEWLGRTGIPQPTDDVAIRIKNTNAWNVDRCEPLLSSSLS